VPRLRFSRRADSDLLEIARYTLRQWGREQARVYVEGLESCCRMLAENPSLGRRCDEVRPGLRRMEHGKHVVFYRLEPEGIIVSRILHERMLPPRHDIF